MMKVQVDIQAGSRFRQTDPTAQYSDAYPAEGGGWWVPLTKRYAFDGPDTLKVGDKVKCNVAFMTLSDAPVDGIVAVVGSDYDGPLKRCWPA